MTLKHPHPTPHTHPPQAMGWAGWWFLVTAPWEPPVPLALLPSWAASTGFPKLKGVTFKDALVDVTKQAQGAGWHCATPPVDSSDLCALSIIFKTLKSTKGKKTPNHWQFTGAVLGWKVSLHVWIKPSLSFPLKGDPAVRYVSPDFNTFSSSRRNTKVQWKMCRF